MQHQQKGLEHRHAAHPGKLPEKLALRAALVGKEPSRGIHGHGVAAAPGNAPQKAPADVPPALGDAALFRAAAGALPADGALLCAKRRWVLYRFTAFLRIYFTTAKGLLQGGVLWYHKGKRAGEGLK